MKVVCYSKADSFGVEQAGHMEECLISLLLLKQLTNLGMKPQGFVLHMYQGKIEEKTRKELQKEKYREHIYLFAKTMEITIIYADPHGLLFLFAEKVQRKDLQIMGVKESYRELIRHIKKGDVYGRKKQRHHAAQLTFRFQKKGRCGIKGKTEPAG